MDKFIVPIQLRWTDIDANHHMRHSAYYDLGAICRMNFFNTQGLAVATFDEMKLGIILLREECVFKREIRYEDNITIDVELTKASKDISRWSLRHHIYKNNDTLAAIITVDGAWIDLEKRKIAVPNEFIQNLFNAFPKAADFAEIVREQRQA